MSWQVLVCLSAVTMMAGQSLVKKLVKGLHPYQIMFYQYLASAIVVFGYHSLVYPQDGMTFKSYPFLGVGVMFAFGVSAYYQAVRYSLSKSVLGSFFSDLITIFLAVIFLGELALLNPATSQGLKTLTGLVLAAGSIWLIKGGKKNGSEK